MIQINFSELPTKVQGLQRVDAAKLQETGRSFGFTLVKGDRIQFPPKDQIAAFNDPFKGSDGTQIDCIKFLCGLNGEKTLLPCGVLTRIPFKDIENWLAAHELNREIYNAGNALARLEMLAGREIIVAEMIKGKRAVIENGAVAKDENGDDKVKDALFPVFAYAE